MFEQLFGHVAEVGDLEVLAEIDQESEVIHLVCISWWFGYGGRFELLLVLFRLVR